MTVKKNKLHFLLQSLCNQNCIILWIQLAKSEEVIKKTEDWARGLERLAGEGVRRRTYLRRNLRRNIATGHSLGLQVTIARVRATCDYRFLMLMITGITHSPNDKRPKRSDRSRPDPSGMNLPIISAFFTLFKSLSELT